jgi:hypothetical protein
LLVVTFQILHEVSFAVCGRGLGTPFLQLWDGKIWKLTSHKL